MIQTEPPTLGQGLLPGQKPNGDHENGFARVTNVGFFLENLDVRSNRTGPLFSCFP
jgi:hypothetical protein